MSEQLPASVIEFMDWPWGKIEPFFQELAGRELSAKTVEEWLADWSGLDEFLDERFERLYVAITVDTTDPEAKRRYDEFLDEIFPHAQKGDQTLKEKLLASGLEPPGFAVPLRNLRAEADNFREENLPLLSEELKLDAEYDKIIGAQTITWEGKELTVAQIRPVLQELDRNQRERAWRLAAERQLADRDAISALWVRLMALRGQLAVNARLADYRAYRWRQLLRFDYTPEDCKSFHRAIEQVVVPAASRVYEKRRQRLGVESLRPWDLHVDPQGRLPLRPYTDIEELDSKTAAIFQKVDLGLGEYYAIMRRENLLDLDNRKGKAPGGYCTDFVASKRPFIFTNAVGLHDDVQTLLHEGGHAFHVFETSALPYFHQKQVPMEFDEVASMGMELLAAPYLAASQGGFYDEADAARARLEHLEEALLFWPYMAVVDAFQHWAYENHAAASDPANCDAQWARLWGRFMPDVDWSGLEQEMVTGWQRKLHIHQVPFYYVEYGLAQLGAVQVWRNALSDQAQAVRNYRKGLQLGGTAPLPALFQAAGAKFAFDAETLQEAVTLMVSTIEVLGG